MKPNVQINLTAAEAEVVHTALAHTRWAYLGLSEREVVVRLTEALLPYRRPEQGPNKHYEARRLKEEAKVYTNNVYVV